MGYRYSTRGYYNFADTRRRMSGYSVETRTALSVKPKFTDYYNLAYSKRGKVQLSVTQQLGRTATLYLSGSHQTYWGTDDADEQLQAGLNAAVDDINWSLSYSLTKTPGSRARSNAGDQYQYPFSHWLRSDSRSVWRHASASQPVARSQWPHDQSGGPVRHPAGRQQPQL